MREHLLGYLLGALEPHEAESFQNKLESDEELRRQLEAMRRCLEPLAVDAGHLSPPVGLATRTCNYVAAQVETTMVRVPSTPIRGWSFADMVVAATILIAVSAVFFPAVNHSRWNAQLAGCQNNLRSFGVAFAQRSDAHGGFLPAKYSGNQNVAGIQVAHLLDEGFIDSDRLAICPASPMALRDDFRIPSPLEVRMATGPELAQMQRDLSGSYGITISYEDDGQLQPLRHRSRSLYALMADSPSLERAHHQTSNHDALGQNVLFEDGHTRYMRNCRDCPHSEDVFHNDDGKLAPGKHMNDSVIAPSNWPPLSISIQ